MSERPAPWRSIRQRFALDALCPGRQQLLRELGDMPEPINEDADRGTRLHKAWQLDDPTGLDSEDVEIYERGLRLVDETIASWKLDVGKVVEGPREERFYFTLDRESFRPADKPTDTIFTR